MTPKEKLMAKLASNKPKDEIKNGMRYTDTHVYFFTDQAPFSNFYKEKFLYKGYNLLFSEQGFMIEKALLFDPEKASQLASVFTPYQAKQIGRSIQNYNDYKWSEVRYSKMVEVLKAKFANEKLKKILLDTGDRILVEGSPYDNIWGVKIDWMSDAILNSKNWRGQNLLGKALMEVREFYRG